MPNYTKTQIYKIVSKDSNITNFYIGSTTNWTKRKQSHKYRCNVVNNKKYNYQIYQIMRDNGGFDNFNMILVEDYPCENKREAEKREQYWKDIMKPDLNTKNAFTIENNIKLNPKEFHKEHYKKRLENNPEYNKELYQKKIQKNPDHNKTKYTCEHCKKEYSLKHKARHEKTIKHLNNLNKEL